MTASYEPEKSSLFTKTKRIIHAIQQLSLAKNYETIRDIVKHAARELVNSDGVTIVLSDNNMCYYVDEDAIAPLWKGKRFPMELCISGWVMLNKQSVTIPDVYQDPRVPTEAYRPTFVKSLVMVPIRKLEPIGAIGNYWQIAYTPSPEDISLLEALADSTAIAIENVRVYSELEQRVQDRTEQLAQANKELEAFSFSVSHDLRAPLRATAGFTHILQKRHEANLDEDGMSLIHKILKGTNKMEELIDALLMLSRITKADMEQMPVDLSAICEELLQEYKDNHPDTTLTWEAEKNIEVFGDRKLLTVLLVNLIGNACKFSSRQEKPHISITRQFTDGHPILLIRDNGVGFAMKDADLIFEPFKRLHSEREFSGTGIGLAIVYRIISRHNGKIWVKSVPNEGTTFYLILPTKITEGSNNHE